MYLLHLLWLLNKKENTQQLSAFLSCLSNIHQKKKEKIKKNICANIEAAVSSPLNLHPNTRQQNKDLKGGEFILKPMDMVVL